MAGPSPGDIGHRFLSASCAARAARDVGGVVVQPPAQARCQATATLTWMPSSPARSAPGSPVASWTVRRSGLRRSAARVAGAVRRVGRRLSTGRAARREQPWAGPRSPRPAWGQVAASPRVSAASGSGRTTVRPSTCSEKVLRRQRGWSQNHRRSRSATNTSRPPMAVSTSRRLQRLRTRAEAHRRPDIRRCGWS